MAERRKLQPLIEGGIPDVLIGTDLNAALSSRGAESHAEFLRGIFLVHEACSEATLPGLSPGSIESIEYQFCGLRTG